MFFWREQSGPVTWGFTDRADGTSTGAFASLNLGGHVGDDPAAVEANRRAVAVALDLPRERLLFLQQCHGADVAVADGPWPGEAPTADGVVTATRRPGAGRARRRLHARPARRPRRRRGRRGPRRPARAWSRGSSTWPWTGCATSGRGASGPWSARRSAAAATRCRRPCGSRQPPPRPRPRPCRGPAPRRSTWPPAWWRSSPPARSPVHWVPGCAREDERLFSYRRDGTTGRYAGVVTAGGRS